MGFIIFSLMLLLLLSTVVLSGYLILSHLLSVLRMFQSTILRQHVAVKTVYVHI